MEYSFTVTIGSDTTCHVRNFLRNLLHSDHIDQQAHSHYSIEVQYVYAGEAELSFPDREAPLRLTPGSILLIPPGVYHSVTTHGKPVERLCFYFSAECNAPEESDLYRRYRSVRQVILSTDPHATQQLQIFRTLMLTANAPLQPELQGTMLLSVVLTLLSGIDSACGKPLPSKQKALDRKWTIEEYIERHFADDLGIEGLAKELFLSKRQTATLVKHFLGEDYKKIIIRRRMELAQILLRRKELSLEEVAWQTGYRSYSGFQLCFKKHFGVTPSRWQETN